MKRNHWKIYLTGALFALGVGGLSAILSMDGMKIYTQIAVKPALSPP